MRLLLDTQCWLWLQVSPERLSAEARQHVEDSAAELVLSAASAWEIAIKYSLGKLPLPMNPAEYVASRMLASGVTSLPITHAHALDVAGLPVHHRDPFDRMLIAQARLERLTVVTADRQFAAYEVEILWAT